MKILSASVFFACIGISCWAAAPLGEDTWPFITIRQTNPTRNPQHFHEEIAINARHPGSADEYWAGSVTTSGRKIETVKGNAAAYDPFRAEMAAAGIAFGSQQGVTIGHRPGLYTPGPDGKKPAWFVDLPDDAYMRGRDGKKMLYFCPRAKAAQDYEADLIEATARYLKPVSIWLDDDMRMAGWKEDGCFCDRCLAAFNAQFGHDLTREALVKRLEDAKRLHDPVRRDWRIFAGESLAEFAAAARRGADRVNPRLRLALQTVNGMYLDAADSYLPCLQALAGTNGLKSAIRTGGGQYFENMPGWFKKSLDCAREAERCHGAPCVAQVSYEQEIYPREVLHKSAEAILIESTMALAGGCDALTEYRWDSRRDEPMCYYEEFASMVSSWRPYLEKVASYSATTTLGGLARFRGANFDQLKEGWVLDHLDFEIAKIGIPVTLFESTAATWYVNEHSLREWGPGDAEKVAAAGAIVHAPVWDRFLKLGGEKVAAAVQAGRIVKFNIGSICRGGSTVGEGTSMPTHQERVAFLDVLDKVGRVAVRTDRAHMLYFYPRVTIRGRTAAVTVVNGSIGKCIPCAVRIRKPLSRKVFWWRPEAQPVPLEVKSGDGDEIVVTMPTLPGMQPGTIVMEADEETVNLQGEPATRPAISPAPFPDRLSAYVWRNWFVVPHDRLAKIVGATEYQLERMAVAMGLPAKVSVQPEWRRRGYITVLRRNWHLLDYPQLLPLLDMTRKELYYSLKEDDFLFHKLGHIKPKCGELTYTGHVDWAALRRIGAMLKAEKADDFSEEPRFSFIDELKRVEPYVPKAKSASPFDFRMIFSYFADYGDPLGDDEIGSYPEGLLQKLAAQGVNAVWLHTVLTTLATDPKYPEFGAGSERRMANLRKLIQRADKYGVKIYLYLNEPRGQTPEFYAARPERAGMKGVTRANDGVHAMCTSDPETLRWLRDAVKQVFANAPGLGGIFTITMSENLTSCASCGRKKDCPRCATRPTADIIAEVNRAMIDGMHAAAPDAWSLVYNWAWPDEDEAAALAKLPKRNCRVLSVSEGRMNICRGGVPVRTHDYSISVVGPGEKSRNFWKLASAQNIATAAKVQANVSWEMSAVPYLPVMDLVAQHASNLVKEGVRGVTLSWSLGCAPAPNLRVYDEMDATGDVEKTLDRLAKNIYGEKAAPLVRRAWTAFSQGYAQFPFSIEVVYNGPMQWGPANPLYAEKTGWRASMVGFPYDDAKNWVSPYPPATWIKLMQEVADGFTRGCAIWNDVIAALTDDPVRQKAAKREYGIFRAAGLHFEASADQARFVLARDAKDATVLRDILARELARAKEALNLVRADSRIGYESSNHYFYTPQDLREKIVICSEMLEGARQ